MIVGAVFLTAAITKLLDFGSTVDGVLRVLPDGIAVPSLSGVIGIEIALGVGMLLGWRSQVMYSATIGVLMLFSVYQILLMFSGAQSCSCGLPGDSWVERFPAWGVIRNCLLIAAVVPALWATRSVGCAHEAGGQGGGSA